MACLTELVTVTGFDAAPLVAVMRCLAAHPMETASRATSINGRVLIKRVTIGEVEWFPPNIVPSLSSDRWWDGDGRRYRPAAVAMTIRWEDGRLTTLVGDNYDPAVRFFVDALGFEWVQGCPIVPVCP